MKNFKMWFCIFATLSAASAAAAYSGVDLPPGPFCGINNQCCVSRRDECSHRILDTLCYCDEFCNRSNTHDDCCPDYLAVCKGITTEPPPAGNLYNSCKHKNKDFLPGQSTLIGCNTCTCTVTKSAYNSSDVVDWHCETEPCLLNDQVIYGVNGETNTWRAANYSQFAGKKLRDGLKYKLGTLPFDIATSRMGSIRYNKKMKYPRSFDARSKWPGFISPIIDQGWCGSDWAVSIAAVASDRYAIQSNGAEKVVLSPQTFLSCNRRGQQGCEGGHVDIAWNFAKNHGIVDEDCFPYKAAVTKCPLKRDGLLTEHGCQPLVAQRTSRYRVGPPGRLQNEEDIMYDLMDSGPIHAIMKVYQDFFHYRDGVYRHSRHGQRESGIHSVRIVGWGEERGDKYWIVANSWGPQWGEGGYFRIARGENQADIESFMVTVLAEVTETYNSRK